jgi:N-acetylglucosamine kinase-like BadF-type ATPase
VTEEAPAGWRPGPAEGRPIAGSAATAAEFAGPPADSAARAAVLAIDGGNSKTDVALIGSDGRVLGVARGGNSNHQGIGRDGTVRVLTELVRAAAAQAGLPAAGPVAQHTSACLAGADLPDEEAELGALIQAQGWSASSEVVNDTFAVLRAGLDDAVEPGAGPADGAGQADRARRHWGIGVVCGAGINCVGVAPDGRTTRFLALGQLSGDWGGGGALGPEALWWAMRAEDGRGPHTELRVAVPGHFGVPEVRDVVVGVYLGKIQYSELHGLVPVLFEVAGRGDQVARDVVVRQADEICLMVTAAARKLELTGGDRPGLPGGDHPRLTGDQPTTPGTNRPAQPRVRGVPARVGTLPVVLGGSLMAARDPLLWGTIRGQLGAALPGANVRIVDVPPVAGAALLGLDHVGAPPSAAARLRESAAATW